MKITVFSATFVTKDNLNGKGIIDIDTPEGIAVFGGELITKRFKEEQKIQNGIRAATIERLKQIPVDRGGLPDDYKEEEI